MKYEFQISDEFRQIFCLLCEMLIWNSSETCHNISSKTPLGMYKWQFWLHKVGVKLPNLIDYLQIEAMFLDP